MLVLSRKIGEEIILGDTITVRVLEIRGNRVKLGFTAPDSVGIRRSEVDLPPVTIEEPIPPHQPGPLSA